MGFFAICQTVLTYFGLIGSSMIPGQYPDAQAPLHLPKTQNVAPLYAHARKGPSFQAPNGPQQAGPFVCEYPEMKGWKPCSSEDNRACWLIGPDGQEFNTTIDYETKWPIGITRKYTITADHMEINGDGVVNPYGKVFNKQYPGPWIQACWGDLINVTVVNKLRHNGTTVHWHGLRQLGTAEMDGVNAITQCPIAPQHSFTYSFRALQYGTSWYHSHYSLQYADGLLGPLTIYGPSSSEYDYARDPILIADWGHRSAFQDWQLQLTGSFPKMNSVLLNGLGISDVVPHSMLIQAGNFAGQFPREIYSMTVQPGKKYLLRIINTSLDTHYIFSIDNHNLTVISSDFVSIKPYTTTNLSIGIGQRYHVILEAKPSNNNNTTPIPPDKNFWIRTVAALGCQGFEPGNVPDERQGILRYNASSKNVPVSQRPAYDTNCHDESLDNLQPVHKWTVPHIDLNANTERFDIGKDRFPNLPAANDSFVWWAFGRNPMWLNFSDPTILNLTNTDWKHDYVVIPEPRQDQSTWTYMVITAPAKPPSGYPTGRGFFPVAHPMHLHGHDFAILAQGNDSTTILGTKLKFNNPPRRDTMLIQSGGYAVIAFKADNPGIWLFHCHIPWHASNGLALQMMERQKDFNAMMTPERLAKTREVCDKWNDWFRNPMNHWNASAPFQDDSGI